jgi:hypothetical protein
MSESEYVVTYLPTLLLLPLVTFRINSATLFGWDTSEAW